MSKSAPVIVFDIGQVLLRWDPKAGFSRYFPDLGDVERFMAETDFFAWHARQDAGRSVAEGIAEQQARHPAHAEAIEGFYRRWLDSVPGEVAGTRVIFETLADRGPVYGLSNFSRELFDETVPHYPFLQRFTGLVLSGDVGINKPDPGIYRALTDRYRLNPADCLFIDDSRPNVEAARALGWDAVVFTDAPTLVADLAVRGVALPGV